ncbi:hypothetical protein MPQ_2763 [Methylovorus sp. MP688]|nr:hypothetical protein MPQ_2763 [Methylovorus sp. MP688]
MSNNGKEWVCESKHHSQTNTDNERSVDQTQQQEHFTLQSWNHFWLASCTFQEASTHDTDTYASASCAKTNDQTDTNTGVCLNHG